MSFTQKQVTQWAQKIADEENRKTVVYLNKHNEWGWSYHSDCFHADGTLTGWFVHWAKNWSVIEPQNEAPTTSRHKFTYGEKLTLSLSWATFDCEVIELTLTSDNQPTYKVKTERGNFFDIHESNLSRKETNP